MSDILNGINVSPKRKGSSMKLAVASKLDLSIWVYILLPFAFIYAEFHIIMIERLHRPPTQVANQQYVDFLSAIDNQFQLNRNIGIAVVLLLMLAALISFKLSIKSRLIRAIPAGLLLAFYLLPVTSH